MLFSTFARRLTIVAVAGLLAGACSDDSGDAGPAADPEADSPTAADNTPRGDDTTTTTSTPEALNPTDLPGAPINRFTLGLGDCFELIEDLDEGRPITITTKLDCDEPHGFEIFHMLLYPADHPSIYPGESAIRQYALESCYREFEPWVGEEYELSALDIDVIVPTQENFENDRARYRGIHCWVERVDGEPMAGTSLQSGW